MKTLRSVVTCGRRAIAFVLATAAVLLLVCQPAGAQAPQRVGRLQPDQTANVSVVLALRNQEQLSALIDGLYNPSDPSYRHYLTPDQFTAEFGPTQADIDSVFQFASAHGLVVSDVSANRTVVHLTGRVSDIESAFGVREYAYRRADGSTYQAPDALPAVPAAMASRTIAILGLDTSARSQRYSHLAPAVPPDVAQLYSLTTTGVSGMAPSDVRSIYNLPLTQTSTNGTGQTLGLFETDGWTPSDITKFQTQYGLPLNAPQLRSVDGGTAEPQTSGASETTLDIDMELTLAPDATILVYESPGIDYGTEAIDILNAIAADDTASVISSSIGGSEQDQSLSFIQAEFQAYAQFAAQGQTMCASGGDSGAYNDQGNYPNTPTVSDPASDPYVLAVGGTFLSDTASEGYVSESSWVDTSDKSHGPDGTGGGGGISVDWQIPSYQVGAFSTSVNTQSSTTMRNIPDVSLYGDFDEGGYSIYYTDPTSGTAAWNTANGTSASSPLYASFLANVNQLRKSKGLGNIGLAQPAIYALAEQPARYAADFHDIDDGSNNLLYVAVAGFDDSTGWGSFNGANLLADLGSFAPTVVPNSLLFIPGTTPAGTTTTGYVTLSGPAPTGGATVTIATGGAAVTTVLVPAGKTGVQFSLATSASSSPGTYTYSASYNSGSVSSTLVLEPAIVITSVSLNPTAVQSGSGSLFTANLNENAPSTGLTLNLYFNGSPWSTLNVAGGASSGSTTVFLTGSPGVYTNIFGAQYGASEQSASLTILQPITSVTLTPPSVVGGSSSQLTINLAGQAPSTAETITLTSSNLSAATIQHSVTIPGGSTSVSVPVTSLKETSTATSLITAAANTSSQSATLTVTAPPAPGVPTNVAAVGGPGVITVSWTGSANATGYELERGATNGGPYGLVATVPSGSSSSYSYVDSGRIVGKTYFYVVIAVNTTYNTKSAASAQVSAAPAPLAPGIPTNVAATAGPGQITIRWTGSANATAYEVERGGASGGPYGLVATVTATSATTYSYTDSGRIVGKTYYYVVIAVNTTYNTKSADSAQVSAAPTPLAPGLPTNVSATAGVKSITVSWNASANANEYELERSATAVGGYSLVTTIPGTSATSYSYTDTGRITGKTYYYEVIALNTTYGTTSGPSAPISIVA